jgi:hypothetical protein
LLMISNPVNEARTNTKSAAINASFIGNLGSSE